MNSILKSSLLAVVVAGVCGVAQADTFTLSGTFDTTTYKGPLNGGTFSGTYDYSGGSFSSFDIFLRDASGATLAEISSANGGTSDSYVSLNDPNLWRVAFRSDASNTNLLGLNFAVPFTGAGTVQLGSGSYIAFANVGGYTLGNVSAVASGMAVAAVPEPTTWGLMGLGLLTMGAVVRRRSKAA